MDAELQSCRESHREEVVLFNAPLLLLPEPTHVLGTSQVSAQEPWFILDWDTPSRKLAFSEEI